MTSRKETKASMPIGTIAQTTNSQKIRRASLLRKNETSIFICGESPQNCDANPT